LRWASDLLPIKKFSASIDRSPRIISNLAAVDFDECTITLTVDPKPTRCRGSDQQHADDQKISHCDSVRLICVSPGGRTQQTLAVRGYPVSDARRLRARNEFDWYDFTQYRIYPVPDSSQQCHASFGIDGRLGDLIVVQNERRPISVLGRGSTLG